MNSSNAVKLSILAIILLIIGVLVGVRISSKNENQKNSISESEYSEQNEQDDNSINEKIEELITQSPQNSNEENEQSNMNVVMTKAAENSIKIVEFKVENDVAAIKERTLKAHIPSDSELKISEDSTATIMGSNFELNVALHYETEIGNYINYKYVGSSDYLGGLIRSDLNQNGYFNDRVLYSSVSDINALSTDTCDYLGNKIQPPCGINGIVLQNNSHETNEIYHIDCKAQTEEGYLACDKIVLSIEKVK